MQGIEPPIEVGTLEGLAYYSNGVDLPAEVYQNCDINYVKELSHSLQNTLYVRNAV